MPLENVRLSRGCNYDGVGHRFFLHRTELSLQPSGRNVTSHDFEVQVVTKVYRIAKAWDEVEAILQIGPSVGRAAALCRFWSVPRIRGVSVSSDRPATGLR